MSFFTPPNIGVSYSLSIGQTYAGVKHSKIVPRLHDKKIWERIVEAFADIGIEGTPTEIAKKLNMRQPSVYQWKAGETTPSRANILAIARLTKWSSGYIEDGTLPKKQLHGPSPNDTDPATMELLATWVQLNAMNRGRLLERASDLLSKQFPEANESRELQRRRD